MITVHIHEPGQQPRTVEFPGEAWRLTAELLVSGQLAQGHRAWIGATPA